MLHPCLFTIISETTHDFRKRRHIAGSTQLCDICGPTSFNTSANVCLPTSVPPSITPPAGYLAALILLTRMRILQEGSTPSSTDSPTIDKYTDIIGYVVTEAELTDNERQQSGGVFVERPASHHTSKTLAVAIIQFYLLVQSYSVESENKEDVFKITLMCIQVQLGAFHSKLEQVRGQVHKDETKEIEVPYQKREYPVAVLGIELSTSDMRRERVTATPPVDVGLIPTFAFEKVNLFALE
ncbi:hypothetical protein T265_08732 [Opisthorchis viverrini]|uniref:Uncharacterized protein n=1 Tax=Opisthorchis viverrini TaxID=6198 RepID=A0A074ZJ31_OPIVI|nr:hypothetical protein T265_08732 [Opisthorchis viverrini]KER23355.1 hypothetical protein T265_08732 [Opisthorchis viverrini]